MHDHFWLIWNERGHAPTVKHLSPESAVQEAQRLAIANPDEEFHILQVIKTARYAKVQWVDYGEFIPF